MATRVDIVAGIRPYETFESRVNSWLEIVEKKGDILNVTFLYERDRPVAYILYRTREEESNEADKDDL